MAYGLSSQSSPLEQNIPEKNNILMPMTTST